MTFLLKSPGALSRALSLRTIPVLALQASMLLSVNSACTRIADIESPSSFIVDVTSDVPEYERPLATFRLSGGGATGAFYPCRLRIDGQVETGLNSSCTTIQCGQRSFSIALPRMSPGQHTVDFMIGRGRTLYRDAEAACGETEVLISKTVNISASDRKVLVLKASATDKDRYLIFPDENRLVRVHPEAEFIPSEAEVLPDKYTVSVCPASLGNEFSIVAFEGTTVEKVATAYGSGINITYPDSGDASFTLAFGGKEVKVGL